MTSGRLTEPTRELIEGLARKEPGAWREFLDLYGDLIYSQVRYTLRRSGFRIPEDEIHDTVQSLFEKLLARGCRRLLSFQGRNGCSLGSWLRVVTTNHTLAMMRKRKWKESLDDLTEEQIHRILDKSGTAKPTGPRDRAEFKETLRLIEENISERSDRERLIYKLYYCDQCSSKEIAQLLEMTSNNVDQILFQIRKNLREKLAGNS